jgi:uncharacterized protein
MKRQVLVIHGGNTFASYEEYLKDLEQKEIDWERLTQKSWKDTLQEELGDDYEIVQPRMPNPHNAKYLEWKIWFEKVVPLLNGSVVLVGHSLGAMFLAKYLAEDEIGLEVKATFLIAPPYKEGANDSLADFKVPEDLSWIMGQGGSVTFYHSRDDVVVPFDNLEEYRKRLPEANFKEFEDRQHFNQTKFPELVEDIKSLN